MAGVVHLGQAWVGRQVIFVVCTVTLFCVHADMIVEWSCLRLYIMIAEWSFLKIILSIYFGYIGSLLLCGLFFSCMNGGNSLVVVHGRLIAVASLVAERGRAYGLH